MIFLKAVQEHILKYILQLQISYSLRLAAWKSPLCTYTATSFKTFNVCIVALTIRKQKRKRPLGRPKHKWQDIANTLVSCNNPSRVIRIIIYLHFMNIKITRR